MNKETLGTLVIFIFLVATFVVLLLIVPTNVGKEDPKPVVEPVVEVVRDWQILSEGNVGWGVIHLIRSRILDKCFVIAKSSGVGGIDIISVDCPN